MMHDSCLVRETYGPFSNVDVVRCHGTAVEALPFITLDVFVWLTRPTVARSND